MRELALFAGAGGGILGGLLLEWRTVCAVEIDPYCRSVLLARQRDGCLKPFPIWDDITTFDGNPWRGSVDAVSGGFPCQPFSTASRGRKTATDLWPEMRRVIDEVRPRFVFAENVLDGYTARVACVAASHMGAPHNRPRWWVVAYSIDGEVARIPRIAKLLWPEPGAEVLGNDDGIPNRMDRLKSLGNAQVPAVAALAWETLMGPLTSTPEPG